ncbi:MAG: sigma factor-like helix-turn-helix DNA-binding protein, partial [Bacteroidota bacterium]
YFKDLNRRESCCISPTATLPSDNPYAQIEVFLRPLVCFLPEKYADPLRLYLFDRLPQREIAARLGLGLSATKSRIARARQLLRREIETCFALEVSTDGRGLVSACLRDSCTPLKEFAKSLP